MIRSSDPRILSSKLSSSLIVDTIDFLYWYFSGILSLRTQFWSWGICLIHSFVGINDQWEYLYYRWIQQYTKALSEHKTFEGIYQGMECNSKTDMSYCYIDHIGFYTFLIGKHKAAFCFRWLSEQSEGWSFLW